MMNFAPSQLKDWKAYERVRKSGEFNMYDPRARRATKLNSERYSFVMKNFTELKEFARLSSANGFFAQEGHGCPGEAGP